MEDLKSIGQSDQSSLNNNGGKNPKSKKWSIIIGALVVVLGVGAYLYTGTDLFKGFIGIETTDKLAACVEYSADEIYVNDKVEFKVKEGCEVQFAVDEDYGKLAVREQNDDTAGENVGGSEKEVAKEEVAGGEADESESEKEKEAAATEAVEAATGVLTVTTAAEAAKEAAEEATTEAVEAATGVLAVTAAATEAVEEATGVLAVTAAATEAVEEATGVLAVTTAAEAAKEAAEEATTEAVEEATDVLTVTAAAETAAAGAAAEADAEAESGNAANSESKDDESTDESSDEESKDDSSGKVLVSHPTLDKVSDLIDPVTAKEGQIVTLIAEKAGVEVFHIRFNDQQWDLDILEKVGGEEVVEEEEEVTVDSILAAMKKGGDVCSLAKQPKVDIKVVSDGYNSFVTLKEYVVKPGESVEVEDPTENRGGYSIYKNPAQGTLEIEEGLSYAANEDYKGEDSVILVQSSVETETRFDLQIIVYEGYKDSVVKVLGQGGMTVTEGDDAIADKGTTGVEIGTILGVLYIEDIELKDTGVLSESVRELITEKISEDIIVGIDGIEVQIPAVETSILEEFNGNLDTVDHINLYCFSDTAPSENTDTNTPSSDTNTPSTVVAPPSGGGGGDGGGGGGGSLIIRRKAADQPDIKIKSEDLSLDKITDIFDCLKENANPAEFEDTNDKAVEFISSIKYGSESIVKGYVEDGETVYEGDEKATRAEILKVMMISSCTPYNVQFEEDIKFKDVSDEDWFNNFVHSAREQDIVEGFEGNVYKPNNYTTRAEALKMLAVMAAGKIEKAPESYELKIADVDKNHWAYDVIKDAEYNNIVVGKQIGLQTLFFPDKEITRYEMATLIYNFYNALLEKN